LSNRLRPKWIGTVGLNPKTRGIYEAMGYHTGQLTRHFMLNEGLARLSLAVLPASSMTLPLASGDTDLQRLSREHYWSATEGLGLDEANQFPRKSRALFEARYLHHPFYEYRVFLASADGAAALVVVRPCRHADALALRVVDFLGEPSVIAGTGGAFVQLLKEEGAEYLDFYASGLDKELGAAGFGNLAHYEGLILPGHFEPFEQRNVNLLYSLYGSKGRLIVCKGDADQDRPNRLEDRP
jgi:hypothetical protein